MEHKIDKKFKSELDQRTMNPNPAAWDRLDAMLSMEEKKKPFFFRSWMAVAAGFSGIMIVALFSIPFFETNNDKLITKNIENNIPNQLENIKSTSNENKTQTAENNQLTNNQTNTTQINHIQKASVILDKNRNEIKNNEEANKKIESVIVNAIAEQNEKTEKNSIIPQTVVENKNVEIVSIENEKSKTVITEFQPKIKLKKVKVDPNALLTNADDEKKSILQRVFVVANNTSSTVYEKITTRNIDVH